MWLEKTGCLIWIAKRALPDAELWLCSLIKVDPVACFACAGLLDIDLPESCPHLQIWWTSAVYKVPEE